RVAMIVYGYTEYEFVMKPELNHSKLQMTQNVWAVGSVTQNSKTSEFFTVENGKLVPYFGKMDIEGYIAEILPSEDERGLEIPEIVIKQVSTYIENCTYTP